MTPEKINLDEYRKKVKKDKIKKDTFFLAYFINNILVFWISYNGSIRFPGSCDWRNVPVMLIR